MLRLFKNQALNILQKTSYPYLQISHIHIPVRPPVIITLIDSELFEKFIKGSGAGGQKINKTNSCVQLKHIPSGITIKTQRFRELQSNRKEARKLLVLALDDLHNGIESKRNLKAEKERVKKIRVKTKSKKKYAEKDGSLVDLVEVDESDTNNEEVTVIADLKLDPTESTIAPLHETPYENIIEVKKNDTLS